LVVVQLVGPKKQKLKEAEDSLQDANRKLQEKQDSLQEVERRVEGLKQQLVNAQREQRELIDQVRPCLRGMLLHVSTASCFPLACNQP
jgi:chromosome segregation ATPase